MMAVHHEGNIIKQRLGCSNLAAAIESNGFSALASVLEALNLHDPTPLGACPGGTNQFFIGLEYDDTSLFPAFAAVGGENIDDIWKKGDLNCAIGTAVLIADQVFTYADFELAAGNGDGNAGFKQIQVNCPANGISLLGAADGNVNVDQIVLSSSAPTDFAIRYANPGGSSKRVLLRAFLAGNDPVSLTFADGVRGEQEQTLKAQCAGSATVQVTVVSPRT